MKTDRRWVMKYADALVTILLVAACSTSNAQNSLQPADENSNIQIQISDPKLFLRELAALARTTGVSDLNAIARLTRWRPELRYEERPKGYSAYVAWKSPENDIRELRLFLLDGPKSNRGRLDISLVAEKYCIRRIDAEIAFANVGELYRTSHPPFALVDEDGRIFGVRFRVNENSGISLTFERQECARRLSVYQH